MREIEKRTSLYGDDILACKYTMDSRAEQGTVSKRTVLINMAGEGYTPNPKATTDIKVKLIDDENILSIKQGSWHADTSREEYEVSFHRHSLAGVIGGLSVMGCERFVLLSSTRTTWYGNGLMHTLDEYQGLGRALFEIEANEAGIGEDDIDQAFSELQLRPMGSPETVAFITGLNEDPRTHVDTNLASNTEIAERMLGEHL